MKAQEQIKVVSLPKASTDRGAVKPSSEDGGSQSVEERGKRVTDMIDCSVIILMVRLTWMFLSATRWAEQA